MIPDLRDRKELAVKESRKKRPVMDWEDWYVLALRYFETHGDLLIPRDYVCETGEKLGRWIERQRAKYNRVPTIKGYIEPWQIEMLNRIGMVWKLEYRRDWASWLEQLDSYVAAHGNADVPHAYMQSGYGLGDWLAKQRLYYDAGKLTEREIAELEARGVRWRARTRRRSWDDWFADAAAYYEARRNLRVTLDYRTPEGNRLGYWIYKQRDIYMGRKKGLRLSPEQIERLNGIGMVWDPLGLQPDAWERMYRWVSAYKDENRKLPLWPLDLKSPDGRSAVGWIRTQRQLLAAEKLPAERAEQLAAIGIFPATSAKAKTLANAE